MNALDLKKNRKKLGITQLELAKMIGVSRKTVVNYEAGRSIPATKREMLHNLFTSNFDKADAKMDFLKANELPPVYSEDPVPDKIKPYLKHLFLKVNTIIENLEAVIDPTIYQLKELAEAYELREKIKKDIEN